MLILSVPEYDLTSKATDPPAPPPPPPSGAPTGFTAKASIPEASIVKPLPTIVSALNTTIPPPFEACEGLFVVTNPAPPAPPKKTLF